DGYTGEQKTKTYYYPKNSFYKNGAYNTEVLTKIISQNYLAQMPWLPLEALSDHRRLGLPFFENPAVEVSYNTSSHEVALTTSNYMECRWEFYTERFMYPSSLEVNS
ncbi:MAG: SusD/RagB family nutrient-binding outer membrane lipoprotein, partial [Tannerellaceae bacterium]|nr:SusD/RagB family nutrient-binding outer membrane lipoprotein [Tannerellaceae bacterium]